MGLHDIIIVFLSIIAVVELRLNILLEIQSFMFKDTILTLVRSVSISSLW